MSRHGLNQRVYDIEYRKLISPQLAPSGKEFDDWITADSEKWQRKMVCQLRAYQAKECGDGNGMDDSDGLWRNLQVKTITDRARTNSDQVREALFGCVCFEIHENGCVELQFCWIHPFLRNKGKLRYLWEGFKVKYGNFYVSTPRSKSMEGFLKAVNYQEPS